MAADLTAGRREGDFVSVVSSLDAAMDRYAERAAIESDGSSLTFAELDAASAFLSERVCERGLGAGRLVAVDVRTPADAVLASIGLLRAGAAFVGVDPGAGHLPPVDGVVTSADLPASIDIKTTAARPAAGARVRAKLGAGDVAYAFFSSGSTGVPKGILVHHDAMASYVDAVVGALSLSAADRWLQVASPGFDVFVEEVFPPLTCGATVVCRTTFQPLGPLALHRAIARGRATIVELSTQQWLTYSKWLDAEGERPAPHLRLVIVGGERMNPDSYRHWQSRWPTALAHVYGTTETAVTSSFYFGMLGEDALDVPLGTPLANTRLEVIDEDGWPAEVGQLVIAGRGVGRGYWNDPARTAERFVPDPDGRPDGRRFLTGDLVRASADGPLFLGRLDDEVKVLGRRVHLSRVVTALRSLPDVEDAAVVAIGTPARRLAAFLVDASADDGARLLTADERAEVVGRLRCLLPQWMLPASFHLVRELPLNDHGKVDRKALALLETEHAPAPSDAADCPDGDSTSEMTAACLAAFRRALGSQTLGPDDNFFDHGGDSLTALEIVDELQEAHGVRGLTPGDLLDAATARELAVLAARRPLTGEPA